MEPQTDREWIMQVDGKVDRMCEAVGKPKKIKLKY